MRHTFTLGLVATLVLTASSLFAQNTFTTSGTAIGYGYGYGGYGGYRNFSSTAAEGYLRGQAATAEALGSYNLNTSEALINREKARSLAIENDRLDISNYFQRQEINRQYRTALRGERPTMADLTRRAKEEAPARLDRYHLDPVFGSITWPTVLQGTRFEDLRTQVERSFRDRDVLNSGLGSPVQRSVARATEAMQLRLKGMIDELNPQEYVLAKRFLQSLEFEAQHSPQLEGVAQLSR